MRLTVLTDRARAAAAGHHLADVVAAACAGGATLVVLREKDLPGAERSALAATLRRVTGEAGVAFGVAAGGPDGVALAVAAGADLVHLAADAPWPGPGATGGMPVGRSCHTPGEVAAAAARGADLVTVSPVFPTASKPGYGPALGPAGVAEAVAAARAGPGPGPAVLALGGIGPGRAAACLAAGAAGVCVMGAVMGATDPAAVSRALADELATAAAGVVAVRVTPVPVVAGGGPAAGRSRGAAPHGR